MDWANTEEGGDELPKRKRFHLTLKHKLR
jgi:hypothetical protein